MQQIQWQDRFSIDVEMIDQAHRQLFSIAQKMMNLYVERHESKFACVEGIKYFKAYALRHFAEEEAYMRGIGYAGYLAHKKVHGKMRHGTLPELERLLYESDFSTEMVQHFIGVCAGWLTGHIIIEDRAIIGERASELIPMQLDDEQSVIQSVIVSPLQEILGCQIQYVSKFSTKDVIWNGQYYELTYSTKRGAGRGSSWRCASSTGIRCDAMRSGKVFFHNEPKIDKFRQEIFRFHFCSADTLCNITPRDWQRHPFPMMLYSHCSYSSDHLE